MVIQETASVKNTLALDFIELLEFSVCDTEAILVPWPMALSI